MCSCLQHTLRHLSRLSNAMLSEDACASVASGQQPMPEEGDAQQLNREQEGLNPEALVTAAARDGELAARLPRLKLKSLRNAARDTAAHASTAEGAHSQNNRRQHIGCLAK